MMDEKYWEQSMKMAEQVPDGGPAIEAYCRYCKHRKKHKCKLHGGLIRNVTCNQLAQMMEQMKDIK